MHKEASSIPAGDQSPLISQFQCALVIGVCVIALASLWASLAPEYDLWSLAVLHSYSLPLRLALCALLLISVIPPVSRFVGDRLASAVTRLGPVAKKISVVVVIGAFLSLMFVLLSENHVLGDGLTLLGNIASGRAFSPTEPLDYLTHYVTYLLLPSGTEGSLWSYRICGLAAGLAFMIILVKLARSRNDWPILLVAVLTFGSVQFFAGYVESYTFSFCFSFWFVMLGWQDLVRGHLRGLTLACFAAACAFHVSSLVLMPAISYLVWRTSGSRLLSVAVLSYMLLLLFNLAVHQKSSLLGGHIFVPLMPSEQNPYHLFSSHHLIDVLNVVLRGFPILLPVLLTKLFWRLPQRAFFLLSLLPALGFSFLIDPKIGAIRDWDLLGIAAAPAMGSLVASLQMVLEADRSRAYRLLLPLLIFATLVTGSWLYFNAQKQEAYEFVREVMRDDPHHSTGYYGGTRLVPWFLIAVNEYNDAPEAIHSLEEYLRANPNDQHNRFQLARLYDAIDQPEKAARLLRDEWSYLLDDPDKVSLAGAVFRNAGDSEQEEALLRAYFDRHGPHDRLTLALADLLLSRGEPDSAWFFVKLTLAAPNSLTLKQKVDFVILSIELGHFDDARATLETIYELLSPPGKKIVDELIPALQVSDRKRAQELADSLANYLTGLRN